MQAKEDISILESIAKKYNISKRDPLNCKKFHTIYEEYKNDYSEIEFAKFIGISERSYKKKIADADDESKEVFVFTNQTISQEEKEKIIEQMIEQYNLYKKQEITLSFFKEMYDNVRVKLTEVEFAELLGVASKSYATFKSRSKTDKDTKIVILGNRELDNIEKTRTILELVQKYDLYKGQPITYDFFLEIYETLKTYLTQNELIVLLGSSVSSLKNIRNGQETARLFMNIELKSETIEYIRKSIINQYEGKKLYYMHNEKNTGEVKFCELYKSYRIYFTPIEFANLMGVSEKNLWYMEHNMANPRIKDIEKVKKVEELQKEIVDMGYYSIEQISDLCSRVDLSIEDFITYYINRAKFFDPTVYKNALENNGGLWLGKTKIEERDLQKYTGMYVNIVNTVVNQINRQYGQYYLEEDMKSEMMLFIVYSCGDLVQNFKYDPKLMERMIWTRARQFCKIKTMEYFNKDFKKTQLIDNMNYTKDNSDNDYEYIDIKNSKNKEELLVELFKSLLVRGFDENSIIEKLSKDFGLQKEEVLTHVKNYLLEKGMVVENEKGEFEIGE